MVLVSYRVRYCTILSEKGAVVLKTVSKQIFTCHGLLKLIETKGPPNLSRDVENVGSIQTPSPSEIKI